MNSIAIGSAILDWLSGVDYHGSRSLGRMDDHLLRDIGLSREDVLAEAKRERRAKRAERKPRLWFRKRQPVWESATTIF